MSKEEEKKSADSVVQINIKVKGQDGTEVFFRIKRNTQLKKLMNAYCDRNSLDFNSIAFLFDGSRIRGNHTPDQLKMEDGDEIDAMLHQTGGTRGLISNNGDHDGTEVFFRIKRNTQLKNLMNAYCDRNSLDFNSIAFLFDGSRIQGNHTPDQLKMEDGDEIDAMLHQTGGTRGN